MKTKEEMLAGLSDGELEAVCSVGDDALASLGRILARSFPITADDCRAELARRDAKAKAAEAKREPKAGEVWKNTETGEFYVISRPTRGYEHAAICLNDGLSWAGTFHNAKDIFHFDNDVFVFYASSPDEFVAKRAAEMGFAIQEVLEQVRAEHAEIRASVVDLGERHKAVVAERDALQAKLSSPAAVAVDNIAKDGACVLVSADHFANIERAKKAMERIRKRLGSHGEETGNSPEGIAEVVDEVLHDRAKLRAELHAPGIVRVPQERYDELMKAEKEREKLADMRRIVAKTLGVALP